MEQRDRVASAGDADEVAMLRRKVAKDFCINIQRAHRIASNVQRPTLNVQRSMKSRQAACFNRLGAAESLCS